jgi:class 3 adenylate cyclase
MPTTEKEKLLRRIADLFRQNKQLSKEVKLLRDKNVEFEKENQDLKRTLAQIPTESIPDKIRSYGAANTQRFDMVTVLFANIEGFKRISNQRGSTTIIDELDNITLEFDKIAAKYKIEKIKTIGDAYMCAGGVPHKNITNPVDVALAAMEMRSYVDSLRESYQFKEKDFWSLQIGIHTGPVTATFHGRKKRTYDIKGETVQIATRVASAGENSQICISANTYELLKEYFLFDYKGSIPVKYRGDIDTFHLKRIKPALSENRKVGKYTNRIFNNKYLLRQFTDLQEFILDKLEKELPDNLYYHNVKHTIDVVNQAELIGYGEGVDDEAILLLKTAALFHDAGHIIDYNEHEYHSTQLASEILPEYQYSEEQIATIGQLIMATQMPPKPQNLLERIICDSDLDYLGRSDFIPVSNTLYQELKAHNKIDNINDWNKLQIIFISGHQYFTKTAMRLREVNKQKQIARLKTLLSDKE